MALLVALRFCFECGTVRISAEMVDARFVQEALILLAIFISLPLAASSCTEGESGRIRDYESPALTS